MKKLPPFKSPREEAEFWTHHDTAAFWDAFEDVKTPLDVAPALRSEIIARHERTKLISLRLYPRQLRLAKAIAHRYHIPYQALLRNLLDRELAQLVPAKALR